VYAHDDDDNDDMAHKNYTHTVALVPHLWRQQRSTARHCQGECSKHPAQKTDHYSKALVQLIVMTTTN